MNRSLLVLGITLAAALPAHADLTHRISSSVQLDVGGASTRAIRVGNSYSISGTGIDTSVTAGGNTTADAIGGLGAATNGVNAITIPDATQNRWQLLQLCQQLHTGRCGAYISSNCGRGSRLWRCD